MGYKNKSKLKKHKMSLKRMTISAATLLALSVMQPADAIKVNPWKALQRMTNTMINYGIPDSNNVESCDGTEDRCKPEPRKYYTRRMNMTRNSTKNMTGNSTGNSTRNSTGNSTVI